MSSYPHYDAIVIGAGVEGSATAYQLSAQGARALLLEQFPLPHSRGSSHGQSRITRKAYPEAFYARMMEYCTPFWLRLQEEAGETIFKQIGYLAIGEENGHFLNDNVMSLKQTGATYTVLSPSAFRRKYPMLRYSDKTGGVFDVDGGILMADKAVRALQAGFQARGGVLRDGEKLVAITPGQIIQVHTNKGGYSCQSLILACGSWTNHVLSHLDLQLPLKPVRISVCYWRETEAGSHCAEKLPTFYETAACGGHDIYGLPSDEYPGHVKLCLHHGPDMDPESRDIPNSQWVLDLIKSYVARHFPGLTPEPSVVETCIYTNTPDKHFVLDVHPKWPNIVIGAGFSGHGFKLAPAVGQILSHLATGKPARWDLSPFAISRFAPGNAKSNL